MYEFQGWLRLARTTTEADPSGDLQLFIRELETQLTQLTWPTAIAEVHWLNGEPILLLAGLVNRRRGEAVQMHKLLQWIALELPGSYGLVYERGDEPDDANHPPGPGAYAVWVIARGNIEMHLDPFISPSRPFLED